MSEGDRDEIWDDGLHFTPAGYERVGLLVAERLIELLGGQEKKAEVKGSESGEQKNGVEEEDR